MRHIVWLGMVFGAGGWFVPQASAQPDLNGPPVTYEVQINGESFRVQGDRVVKVQSKDKPGVTYDLAIRISPTQQLRLKTLKLDYDLPAKVSEDRAGDHWSVQIRHELGFSIMVTDLGRPLDAKDREETLKLVTDFASGKARDQKGQDIQVGEPKERKFGNSTGKGGKVHYVDANGGGRTCLAYVLTGEKFAATCVIEYLDKDSEDSLPLIKKTLDSIQAAP